MKKHKAYKFRLYPNDRQKEYFAKCFGSVRFLYNKMLEERIELYKKYKSDKEELKYHKPKTYTQYKHEYPWLYEVDSHALANAQIDLQRAYEKFFSDKTAGFPKFKSKHKDRDSYTTNNCNGNFRIENKHIFIPKIRFVRVVQHRQIPSNQIIKSYTISKTKTNKYYVSILVEWEEGEKKEELNLDRAVGLDYSSPHFYVDSQGIKADYPKFYRMAEERLKREQRKLSKCKKGSKNYEKQRLMLAIAHERVANCRRDWLEKLSCRIAKDNDIICIENLNMQAISQCLSLGKSTMDNGWGMFVNMLERKAKRVVKIDKWFPSSRLCPKCGSINKNLSLKDRVWTCECGAVLDRDFNAANNILNEGLKWLEV